MYIIRRIKEYWAREIARLQKLQTMFQLGMEVRNVSDGEVYTVEWVGDAAALLRRKKGGQRLVNWLSRSGSLRTAVADEWNPVVAEVVAQMT